MRIIFNHFFFVFIYVCARGTHIGFAFSYYFIYSNLMIKFNHSRNGTNYQQQQILLEKVKFSDKLIKIRKKGQLSLYMAQRIN